MTERMALERVEEVHGSIEQFALHILTEARDVLDGAKAITLRADKVGLEPQVLNFLLTQSQAFRRMMRGIMVNQVFDLDSEQKHIQRVKIAATDEVKKNVVTSKGTIVKVDHTPEDVMKAGEYLNKYRGTPLSAGEIQSGPSLIINFGSPGGGSGDDGKTITVEEAPAGFKSLRAGGLPPEGARKRYLAGEVGPAERHALTRTGSELDFDSEEAKSKAESKANQGSDELSGQPDARGGNGGRDRPDWAENWE